VALGTFRFLLGREVLDFFKLVAALVQRYAYNGKVADLQGDFLALYPLYLHLATTTNLDLAATFVGADARGEFARAYSLPPIPQRSGMDGARGFKFSSGFVLSGIALPKWPYLTE